MSASVIKNASSRRSVLILGYLLWGCSSSPAPEGPAVDAGDRDVADQSVSDTNVADTGLGPEVSSEGGAADAVACLYANPNTIRYTLRHFDFAVTTPSGVEYGRSSFASDASSPLPTPLSGVVTESPGHSFKVDTCLPGDACQPAVYAFRFCSTYNCANESSSELQVRLPVGRKVRVDYQLVAPGGFAPGAAYLTVRDDEASATQGTVLFAGAGGMYVSEGARYTPAELPFDLTLRRKDCGSAQDGGFHLGADYNMIVARRDGQGQTLAVATGEAGDLDYALASGQAARVRVHCLSAVQPNATDDYWNWDFWMGLP